MSENNGNSGSGSATTVLVSVIIVVIIGVAFYFGFARGNWGNTGGDGINVDVTLPEGSGLPGTPAE